MKITILEKFVILSVIILAGNLFVGYAVYESNHKHLESQRWVQHTEKVIFEAGNILSFTKDIEIASRSFVITSDSAFLEPYDHVKTTFAYLEQLRQLALDNPAQQQRLDSLRFYLHKYLDFSYQAVEVRRNKGSASAIALISTKQGQKDVENIYRITFNIQQEEASLLKQRKQANERSEALFKVLTVVMFILMTLLTVFLFVVIAKYLIQNKEKEKRAAELVIANKELHFQNEEKEKRAAELVIAIKELHFQNEEKEKRAAELVIAIKELHFQNEEKEKRAAEFVITNKELHFQNVENDKQEVANKELEAFSYSVSHDLRAPLRHIGGYVDLLIKNNSAQLDEKGLRYLDIILESSIEMGNLIDALLTFSRLSRTDIQRTTINSGNMVNRVLKSFNEEIAVRNVEISISELPDVRGDEELISQVWVNLLSNALKYSRKKEKAVITIGSLIGPQEKIFFVRDNGAGFDMKYADKLYGVFQRLHKARDFEGIGIGLANVNRIIVRHGGKCWAEGEVDNGAVFFFSLPG